MNHAFMSRRFASGPQRGLTLVELMVSLTIGLLVTVAAASVYLMARQGFTTNEDQSRTFESGRLVVDQLSRNLRMAGAPFFNAADLNLNTGGIRPFPVDAIVGVEGGAAPDSISIAYANVDPYSATTLMGADCEGEAIGAGAGAGEVVVNSFFITPGTQPRLACVGNGAGATPGGGATVAGLNADIALFALGRWEPIADQVVDMQVMYGMASTASPGSAVIYVDANGVAAAGGWGLVRSADICLDIASLAIQNIPGGRTPGFNCRRPDTLFPADNLQHRLFRFTVNRRNETTGNIIAGPP